MRLKRCVNRILSCFGYKLERIDRFRQLLESEYQRSEHFSFIQIGANDGIQFDELFSFVIQRKCRGIVLEPLSYYYAQLKRNYAHYPAIVPLKLAIHKNQSRATIYYVDPGKLANLPAWASGIGSFDPDHYKRGLTIQSKKGITPECMITEEVDCVRLMDLVAAHGLFDANLLQIDAEGYDGEIIRMIDFKRFKPSLIKCEHISLTRSEKTGIVELLRANGYQLFFQNDNLIAHYTVRQSNL